MSSLDQYLSIKSIFGRALYALEYQDFLLLCMEEGDWEDLVFMLYRKEYSFDINIAIAAMNDKEHYALIGRCRINKKIKIDLLDKPLKPKEFLSYVEDGTIEWIRELSDERFILLVGKENVDIR